MKKIEKKVIRKIVKNKNNILELQKKLLYICIHTYVPMDDIVRMAKFNRG